MYENRPSARSPKVAIVTDDCFAALVCAFKASPKWAKYRPGTRELWGRELDLISRPDILGAKKVEDLKPSLIQAYLDGLDGRPGKQMAARAVLIQIEKWALVRELLPRQITLGVETDSPKGGHLPWSDDQVALGERFAAPKFSRLITLAANTGQRGSDLIRLGPTDVEVFQGIAGINVVQQKTGRKVWVPITAALSAVMATWERRPGPWLIREDGSAWPKRGIMTVGWNWHRKHVEELAPLRDCVIHGLRGTACVRLRQSGATIPQIADMVGMSARMVERYCRFSVQKENAAAAVIHLDRTLAEHGSNRFSQKRI